MSKNVSSIEALHQFVERTYAAGITAPYDTTMFCGVLALANIGFGEQSRMIDLAAAMLNSLADVDRQVVIETYDIPGPVLQKIGSSITWPEPRVIEDVLSPLTPEQEEAYRDQLERAINYHAEKEAARVITFGTRKQHTYREKEREANALLKKGFPEQEDPTNWPYLNSEVLAGIEPDIISAANVIVNLAANWRYLDARIETITRTGVHRVRAAPIEEIKAAADETNVQVTALIDQALAQGA